MIFPGTPSWPSVSSSPPAKSTTPSRRWRSTRAWSTPPTWRAWWCQSKHLRVSPHQSIKNRITRTPHKEEEPPTHDPATGPALLWRPTFILWKIIIAIINQRFSIGINEDLLNLFSKFGNKKSEIQQYKSKPSSLENALKLRYMPSLKLNYSSGAFSRALLHNKKVRTRYFGDETS